MEARPTDPSAARNELLVLRVGDTKTRWKGHKYSKLVKFLVDGSVGCVFVLYPGT